MRRNNNSGLGGKFRLFRILIYLFVAFSLSASLYKNISRIGRAENSIEEAKINVEKLESEKSKLEEQLKNVESEVYLETKLRDGLGLAKGNEIVIILPDEDVLRKVAPDIIENEAEIVEIPNWKKWKILFFNELEV